MQACSQQWYAPQVFLRGGVHPLIAEAENGFFPELIYKGTYGNLSYSTWDRDNDGTGDFVMITGSSDTSVTEIEIPSEIDGIPVIEIGTEAFSHYTSLVSVTIPDSVMLIDWGAFASCTSLEIITIPDSVTCIDSCAFSNCTSLENITIENPECEIYDDKSTISDTATIYGYENSTAQSYAEKYSRNFEIITESEFIQGDISGNGKIDLYDAIEICKSIMGMRTFTDEEKAIADFDGNGVVDLYDAIGIAKELLPK